MKLSLLALLTLVFSFETFAQRRPSPRPGRGPVVVRPGPVRGPVVVRPGPRVVGPRYNPNGSRRVIRTVIRPTPIWNSGFGYYCDSRASLVNNGYRVHDFFFNSDCEQAVRDIRAYGDFCDGSDLYDQSGRLEAQFTFTSECRQALGWYY